MCKLKITLTADAPVKELVELLVKAVKGGTLTAFIDEGPIRFRVSGAGFRFDTPEGIDVPEKENGERKSICVKVILVPRAFSLPRPPGDEDVSKSSVYMTRTLLTQQTLSRILFLTFRPGSELFCVMSGMSLEISTGPSLGVRSRVRIDPGLETRTGPDLKSVGRNWLRLAGQNWSRPGSQD